MRTEKRFIKKGSLTLTLIVTLIGSVSLFSCASVQKVEEARAHYKMGVSHLNVGNIQTAFVEFQKALELDPDNKEVHNAVGVVYLQLFDLEKAKQSFLNAVKVESNYSEAHNNLCFVYYRTKRFKKAIKSCKKALQNPLYVTPEKAFYNLGRSYYKLGRYNEAVDAFTDAIRRLPGLYPAYYSLALAYNAKQMYGNAASAIAKAIELDPRFRGDAGKAEEEFKKQAAEAQERRDLQDFLEILKY